LRRQRNAGEELHGREELGPCSPDVGHGIHHEASLTPAEVKVAIWV